jgi:hypothetical protein
MLVFPGLEALAASQGHGLIPAITDVFAQPPAHDKVKYRLLSEGNAGNIVCGIVSGSAGSATLFFW